MSTGGSSKAPTEQNITQTNIPKEFEPYFKRLIGRAEEQSAQGYQPYGAPRIADSSQFGDIGASQNLTRQIAGSGIAGLPQAQAAAQQNIQRANQLGQYGPGQFSQYQGFQAGQATPFTGFQAGQGREFNFNPAEQFTGGNVEQYMSPYMTNVMDFQKSRAIEDFDRLRGGRNTRAVQAGAFGGSRQGVQEGMAEEALMQQLGGIDATGRQAAFDAASQQFGADRAARMATEQARAGEAARVQGIGVDEGARVQQARAAELARTQGISIEEAARIQAAQAGELGRVQTGMEASRQFGAGQGLAALEASRASAGQLAALGGQQREAGIQNAQMLDAIGRAQQAERQAGLDIGYQDFLRQQGYPQEQLGFYSDMLRGLPVANIGTVNSQNYQSYNPMQQALGAGLSGLSLYKAFQ